MSTIPANSCWIGSLRAGRHPVLWQRGLSKPLLQLPRIVPIVFTAWPDPVGGGFVDTLSRPGVTSRALCCSSTA